MSTMSTLNFHSLLFRRVSHHHQIMEYFGNELLAILSAKTEPPWGHRSKTYGRKEGETKFKELLYFGKNNLLQR